MSKLKDIVAQIDADKARGITRHEWCDDWEAAVREHLVDLEEAVAILKANSLSSHDVNGDEETHMVAVEQRDIERLEAL